MDVDPAQTGPGPAAPPSRRGAPGTPAGGHVFQEDAVRTCNVCLAKSTDEGMDWQKYEVNGRVRIPVGPWCNRCPVGIKVGQFPGTGLL